MITTKSKYLVFGPKKILTVLAGLVAIGAIVWVVLLAGRVKSLTCSTQFGECPEQYVSRLQFLVGSSWYKLPKKETILPYLSSYVEVGDIAFSRKFPSGLHSVITLRKAVGVVNDLQVDETGVLFGVAGDSALPKLNTTESYSLGNTLTTGQVTAIQVLGELSTQASHRIEGTIQGPVLTTILDNVVLLFDVENIQKNWNDSLQLILARSKIDGKVPRRVDLRFNNPIIQY